MKQKLVFNVFGTSSIFFDQDKIHFPFAKIKALLFYLLVNGQTDRDEIAELLWENKDSQTAKKNLRNAIYQANKRFGFEVITSPNRTTLLLNPSLNIDSDFATFSEQPTDALDLYKGDFLKGFYLKDSEQFDFWVSKVRTELEQIYIRSCHQKIEQELTNDQLDETENNIRRLIAIDEFDEENYLLLMQFYQKHNRPSKVIETYYELVNLLDKELGIEPDDSIQELYKEVVAQHNREQSIKRLLRHTDYFFGRAHEIEQLETYFTRTLEENEATVFVLTGDMGTGKRSVTRQVLANQASKFHIILAECFREDRDSQLAPWYMIFDELTHLSEQESNSSQPVLKERLQACLESQNNISSHLPLLAHVISQALKTMAQKEPLAIVIENCHWMDEVSLKLLQALVGHIKHQPIAFVLTRQPQTNPPLEHFLNQLIDQQRIECLQLSPLSRQESLAYLKTCLNYCSLGHEELDHIYQISQGNSFLLAEYGKQLAKGETFSPLTPAICAKIGLRLSGLSGYEEELLNYLACFQEGSELTILSHVMTLSLEDVTAIIDALKAKYLLVENLQNEEIMLSFRQPIFQLYLYNKLTPAKKRILHGQIAQALEKGLTISPQEPLLQAVAYHYHMAKQELKSLGYQLEYLKSTLRFQHELFPIYSRQAPVDETVKENEQGSLTEQFATIRHNIDKLEEKHRQQDDFQKLVLRFLYLEGRYFIHIGQYQQGMANIQRVIALAKELQDMEYLLEGYRQIIYYCIQVENISAMRYYTKLALDASVQANNYEAIGIMFRLKGVCHLMAGDEEKAIAFNQKSIDCFSITSDLQQKYAINIAAALDYLAEIEQVKGNYQQAISYQKRAIALTEMKTSHSSMVTFTIGLGISYYLSGDFQTAEYILMEAKKEIQSLSFPWKEAQLEVYLALIHLKKGVFQPIISLLKHREKLINRYSNPRDKGVIYCLMAILKYHLMQDELPHQEFASLLAEEFNYYYIVAINNLNSYRDYHLLHKLQKVKAKVDRVQK